MGLDLLHCLFGHCNTANTFRVSCAHIKVAEGIVCYVVGQLLAQFYSSKLTAYRPYLSAVINPSFCIISMMIMVFRYRKRKSVLTFSWIVVLISTLFSGITWWRFVSRELRQDFLGCLVFLEFQQIFFGIYVLIDIRRLLLDI